MKTDPVTFKISPDKHQSKAWIDVIVVETNVELQKLFGKRKPCAARFCPKTETVAFFDGESPSSLSKTRPCCVGKLVFRRKFLCLHVVVHECAHAGQHYSTLVTLFKHKRGSFRSRSEGDEYYIEGVGSWTEYIFTETWKKLRTRFWIE